MFYSQAMKDNKHQYRRNIEIREDTEFPQNMQRIALGVEYSGTSFRGFQKQHSAPNTVQAALEKALSKIAAEPISLVCAGRTDAGVHATGQVIHFDTLAERPDKAWVLGVNTHLPDGIRVNWAVNTGPSFHARFSAMARTYRYVIYRSVVRSAIMQKQVAAVVDPLDISLMHDSAQCLVGEHDFSAFRAAQCQAHSPVRCVEYVRICEKGAFIVLEIRANAFLHHMVRNIVGSLLAVGRQQKPVDWIADLLEGCDRTRAAATASPYGLYLVGVEYPERFNLPVDDLGPIFLAP